MTSASNCDGFNSARSERALRAFTGVGYIKGRPKVVQAAWFVTMNLVFIKWWCPARLRVAILRFFGARIGQRVLIRHRVRVLWPWKLWIGDDTWIGEGAWLLNLEEIKIGANVCVSQEAFLVTGSHRASSPTFEYDNAPIHIEDGAWVAARAILNRGVRLPQGTVVKCGAIVSRREYPLTEA